MLLPCERRRLLLAVLIFLVFVLLVLTAGAAAAATAAQIGEVELQLLAAVGAKDAAIGQDVLIKEDFLFTVGAGGLVDLDRKSVV